MVVSALVGGFNGRRGMMHHLAVAHAYRRVGEQLKSKGCICYYLLVTKDNAEADRFFQSRSRESMDNLYAFAKDLN